MTPLERAIRERIQAEGAISVEAFMEACNTYYYATRDPLGRDGDFTTAPEVSQMFGELVGAALADCWKRAGAPGDAIYAELGPGRGTLAADALRVLRTAGFAGEVHLVETSPVLRDAQAKAVPDATWHDSVEDLPARPLLLVANEFFDALPINQAVKQTDGWHTRCVGLNAEGQFEYTTAPEPMPQFERTLPEAVRQARDGEIFEWRSDIEPMELGRRLAREPGAALVIDYGHGESGTGETLQAVHKHLFADPLTRPGEADLTAHVDFEAMARPVESMGAVAHGPVDQAVFLNRLGIRTRAETLKANLDRAKAHEIDQALARLTGIGRTGMGTLFKAMAFTHRSLPLPPGFEH